MPATDAARSANCANASSRQLRLTHADTR